MLFHDITIIDENFEVREHQYVGTKGDRIAIISDRLPIEPYGEVYDGKGKLLLPSFYNCHSHLPMALMRGYGENLPLSRWLNERIFPFEANWTDEDMYHACLIGAAESLRYGIGATREMYLSLPPLGKALTESGMKALFSRCAFGFGGATYEEQPIAAANEEAREQYAGGRVRFEYSLHAEYTTNEKVVRSLAEIAKKNNCSIHVHVSETKSEVEECKARHDGKSPVRYLADCGLFDVPTGAAHCVWVDSDDIAILKEKGVTVAANPKSNAKLASGISPVTEMLAAGVNVAIGTDSVASNNNLDMVEEMRFFNLLQKARTLDPTVISAKETLYAATRAGALAFGLADSGLVKEGFKADLAVMDISTVNWFPVHDLLNNLIYSASGSNVVLTMVDGNTLYRDGSFSTIDVERTEFWAERARKRMLGM